MAKKSGDCYVDVWRDTDFRGEMIRIQGPGEYAALDFTQGDWGDDIGSLRVGPNAFVMAYRRRDFKDRLVTFGPNDEVADLGEFKFDDDIESMKVIDSLKIFDRVSYNSALASGAAGTSPAGVGGDTPPSRNKAKHGKGRRR